MVLLLFLVIRLVSGLNSEVEGTLGGLRRAHVTTPGENGVRTGLMLHPQSKALVLNSTPGLLQFYDTETQHLSSEVSETCYLSSEVPLLRSEVMTLLAAVAVASEAL